MIFIIQPPIGCTKQHDMSPGAGVTNGADAPCTAEAAMPDVWIPAKLNAQLNCFFFYY